MFNRYVVINYKGSKIELINNFSLYLLTWEEIKVNGVTLKKTSPYRKGFTRIISGECKLNNEELMIEGRFGAKEDNPFGIGMQIYINGVLYGGDDRILEPTHYIKFFKKPWHTVYFILINLIFYFILFQ